MKLRKFSRREKSILYVTIGITLAVILFHLCIKPTLTLIEGMDEEIERKAFLLGKYFRVVKGGESAVSLYENHKDALEEKDNPQEVISNLFEKIEKIAVKSGVVIKRVKPRSVKDKKEHKEAILEVELEGDFSSLFRFINNLETAPYLIRVSSFRLLPQLRSSKQLRCRLSLSKVFF